MRDHKCTIPREIIAKMRGTKDEQRSFSELVIYHCSSSGKRSSLRCRWILYTCLLYLHTYTLLINRGFLWRIDVCLLINGPGNWDTRRKRGGVSWWGEQHHQRGRAYASTRSRSPRYTERCLLRSITQNGACSDLPLGLMRLPYRPFLHQYRNFPPNSQS